MWHCFTERKLLEKNVVVVRRRRSPFTPLCSWNAEKRIDKVHKCAITFHSFTPQPQLCLANGIVFAIQATVHVLHSASAAGVLAPPP